MALLLLADVTKKASLPGRRVSLFALAEALCARKVKIDLLSRGSEFEGKYTALWPDVSEVSRETEEVFNSLIENHENAMTELVNIAEEVRELFLSMTEDKKEAGLSSADEDEEKVTEQQENGESSAEHTQIKLEFDSEEKALEDVEKEKMRRLRPEKLEKKFRELQASGTSGKCGKTGAFPAAVPS